MVNFHQILMKLKIWNPYGLGISNFEFHQNRRQKIFLTSKTRVFDVFKLKLGNFQINLRAKGGPGHTSRCQNIIMEGLNLTLHMVIRVARPPQFLAALRPKRSIALRICGVWLRSVLDIIYSKYLASPNVPNSSNYG